MPVGLRFGHPPDEEILSWVGRAVAAIQRWDRVYRSSCTVIVGKLHSSTQSDQALPELRILLHQARADLRMEVGQLSVVVQAGQVFDYFDELRKVIETARKEVFFVDPYLDAEFVSRYFLRWSMGLGFVCLEAPSAW